MGKSLFIASAFHIDLMLDRPRHGFNYLDQMNNAVVELRQMFPEKSKIIKSCAKQLVYEPVCKLGEVG